MVSCFSMRTSCLARRGLRPKLVPCSQRTFFALVPAFCRSSGGNLCHLSGTPIPYVSPSPPGLAFFFGGEGLLGHGGAALQELLIPHLISRMETQERRIGIDVLVALTELIRSSVKVVLQPRASAESATSQMNLFVELGRTLRLDVLRLLPAEKHSLS